MRQVHPAGPIRGKTQDSGVGESEILRMNLESSEYENISDFRDLNAYLRNNIPAKGRSYVFLDEIQRVKEWERSVNALMVDTDADIYITGSNAHMLSTDLSTFLTGRYIRIGVLPLSFTEYRELRGMERPAGEVFEEYTEYGGFPGVDPSSGETAADSALDDLYNSIVYRDAVSRGRVRRPEDLEKMVVHLMLNVGDPVSAGTVSKDLDMNVRTVDRYMSLPEGACLFYRANRYDLKSAALNPSPNYYSVDPGLRNHAVGLAGKDRGRVLENIVYLELIRRRYKVIVGKWDSREVDFVAEKTAGQREYYQVCLGYQDEDAETRELAPLRAIKDSFPKTVILGNGYGKSTTRDGITERDIVDWLTEETDGRT